METQLDICTNRDYCRDNLKVYEKYNGVCIRFLSGTPGPLPVGKLTEVRGLEEVSQIPGVKSADFYNRFKGLSLPETIPTLNDGSDRFFFIVTAANDFETARKINLKAEDKLNFLVQ